MSPVFDETGKDILFYTASRGHHRDIGGLGGISGNPNATTLEQEGAMFKSFLLASGGHFDEEGITKLLVQDPAQYPGCVGSNSLRDNLSDLKAQIAANQRGTLLIEELFAIHTAPVVQKYMAAIQHTAEIAVRNHLKWMVVEAIAAGRHTAGCPLVLEAEDYLDDGTEIHLRISIDGETGNALFDFTGTGPEVYGNRNAPTTLVYSAIIYCLRAMIDDDIPLNQVNALLIHTIFGNQPTLAFTLTNTHSPEPKQGCLAPVDIVLPKNTVLSPSSGAAVYTGNTLTSQRVTDVVFKAFQTCAASQGDMNSVQMYGGEKKGPNQAFAGYSFIYGETICGGSGAGPSWNGNYSYLLRICQV